jgi:hypothetical protein
MTCPQDFGNAFTTTCDSAGKRLTSQRRTLGCHNRDGITCPSPNGRFDFRILPSLV